MKLLFIGDVVGEAGCAFLQRKLPGLKREYGADILVVNGENSANGNGITVHSSKMILQSGADVITTGNHAFQRKESLRIYDAPNIIRPANYSAACPGTGVCTLDLGDCRIAVINLSGRLYMEPLDNPFTVLDSILPALDTPNIFIDFHAEATSEKRAMGLYAAGRVTAVMGTHTHVQTSDACILDGATGYITDVGMTGVEDSVLGADRTIAVNRFRLHLPQRLPEAKGDCFMGGALVEFDKKCGKCMKITAVIVR